MLTSIASWGSFRSANFLVNLKIFSSVKRGIHLNTWEFLKKKLVILNSKFTLVSLLNITIAFYTTYFIVSLSVTEWTMYISMNFTGIIEIFSRMVNSSRKEDFQQKFILFFHCLLFIIYFVIYFIFFFFYMLKKEWEYFFSFLI